MEKVKKVVDYIFFIIYLIFIVIFLKNILLDVSKIYRFIFFTLCLLTIGIIYLLRKRKKVLKCKTVWLAVGIILSVIGISIRIFLTKLNYLTPFSDYLTFYDNATFFSENTKILNSRYIALFPYLSGYIVSLGTFFKIFSVKYVNVIFFNIVIDILTSLVLCITFRKKSLVGAVLIMASWLINPINIVWCAFAYPISIINFFIVLSLCMIQSWEGRDNNLKIFIVYNILLGLVLALGNQFRPIFIIFVIALFICRLYQFLFEKHSTKGMLILGMAILILVYVIADNLLVHTMQLFNSEEFSKTQGWTLYVGANIDSEGSWNLEDSKYFYEVGENKTADETQIYMKNEAIRRVKNNGIIDDLKLLVDKFRILTSSLGGYSAQSFNYIQISYESALVDKIVSMVLKVTCFIIVYSNLFVGIYYKNLKVKMIYMLVSLGIILSHLLVEVSPRYSIQAYIPMQILGIIILCDILFKNKKDDNKEEIKLLRLI